MNLYAYLPWREQAVVATIREEYDFEGSPDTASTWRIGDGTAAFYNYIFYTAAGFTENDAFRSNQVREGVLTRAEALSLAAAENLPRYESIFWYLDIIGLETPMHEALRIIQAMPKAPSCARAERGRREVKVLLIQPPAPNIIRESLPAVVEDETGVYPPLGLLYMAAHAGAVAGVEVEVLDCQAEGIAHADLGGACGNSRRTSSGSRR